jgi:hypothetical protein
MAEAIAHSRERARPSKRSEEFSNLLSRAGWPGTRPLTPVEVQAVAAALATVVPPPPPVTNPVTLANVTTTCTACHGLTVNTTVFKSGGYSASGRNSAGWVSSLQGMLGSGWTPSVPAGATLQNYADFLATVK